MNHTKVATLFPKPKTKPRRKTTIPKALREQVWLKTMKKSFESVLKFAGISAGRDGGTRTLYSLRHFYATQRLSHETSPFLLAKQMGTSVEMLEKFYGQTVSSALAARISKGNQTVGDGNGKVYPFG